MKFDSRFTRMLLAGLALTTVLAGCYTYDPYSNEKQVSKTTTGAGIGAAVGAVAGILTGDDSRDRRKRALIGAGVRRAGGWCSR